MSAWIDQIFTAEAVAKGEVVRRNLADVIKFSTLAELQAEVKARGFHLIQNGDQLIILCNQGDVKIIC